MFWPLLRLRAERLDLLRRLPRNPRRQRSPREAEEEGAEAALAHPRADLHLAVELEADLAAYLDLAVDQALHLFVQEVKPPQPLNHALALDLDQAADGAARAGASHPETHPAVSHGLHALALALDQTQDAVLRAAVEQAVLRLPAPELELTLEVDPAVDLAADLTPTGAAEPGEPAETTTTVLEDGDASQTGSNSDTATTSLEDTEEGAAESQEDVEESQEDAAESQLAVASALLLHSDDLSSLNN